LILKGDKMTKTPESTARCGFDPQQTTMVAPPDLRLRVRPAELARIFGVSKQGVSKAIRSGRIRVDADGRLDPAVATRDWLKNTHPASMRSRVMRDASAAQRTAADQAAHWRAEADEARAALATERERARAVRTAAAHAALDALAETLPAVADGLSQLAVDLAERHGAARLQRAHGRGALSGLAYRHAWRVLAPALLEALGADAETTPHPAALALPFDEGDDAR
jgi:hypothetical protein